MLSTLIDDLQEHAEFYHTAALNAEDPAMTEYLRARTQQSLDFIAELEAATQSASPAQAEQSSADSDLATPDDGPLAGLRRGVTTVTAGMTIEADKTDQRVLEDARKADERLLASYADATSTSAVAHPTAARKPPAQSASSRHRLYRCPQTEHR